MKLNFIFCLFSFAGLFPFQSYAWTQVSNATITSIAEWEDTESSSPASFLRSDGVWCYVPIGQKTLYALILSLYATKTPADYACYDAADIVHDGFPAAHKLNRVISH